MKRVMRIVLPVCVLLCLPGCAVLDFFRGGSAGVPRPSGTPLIEFGSQSMYGSDDFQRRMDVMASAQDNFEAMMKSLPRETLLRFFEDSTEEYCTKLLVREYVAAKGLNQGAEHQALVREAHMTLDLDLNLELFKKELLKEAATRVQNLSDEELRRLYNEQRDMVAKQGEDKAKSFPVFEQVRSQIVEMAKQQEFAKLCNERLAELRAKHEVKVNKEFFREYVAALVPDASAAEPVTPTIPADLANPVAGMDESVEEEPLANAATGPQAA